MSGSRKSRANLGRAKSIRGVPRLCPCLSLCAKHPILTPHCRLFLRLIGLKPLRDCRDMEVDGVVMQEGIVPTFNMQEELISFQVRSFQLPFN